MLSLAILPGCQITGKQNTEIQNNSSVAEKAPIQTQETSSQETSNQAAKAVIISKITLSDQPPDKCNSPMGFMETSDPNHHATAMPDGNISFWGDAYISAEIPEDSTKDFKVQWYIGETDSNPQSREDFTGTGSMDRFVTQWILHSSQTDLTPAKSCDGKLYLHVTTPSLESDFGVMGTWLSPRKAVFLSNNEIVGETSFYFQQ